jgi:hypothetical protein
MPLAKNKSLGFLKLNKPNKPKRPFFANTVPDKFQFNLFDLTDTPYWSNRWRRVTQNSPKIFRLFGFTIILM